MNDSLTQTLNLSPQVIRRLSYHSKCRLAGHLNVVDPGKVPVRGTITLDGLGSFVSAEAEVLCRVKVLNGEFPGHSATVLEMIDTGGLLKVQIDGLEYRSEWMTPEWVTPLPTEQDDFIEQDEDQDY